MNDVNLRDYPLFNKRPEIIKSLTGKSLGEITVEAIVNGKIMDQDIRISPKTLELQAQIAENSGRKSVAKNFRRAAELCDVPDELVLSIYEALRPHRCTAGELEAIATQLEVEFNAVLNAELVREAACAYSERGLLKSD
jgi:propanediol dehydratase small subunit